MSAGRRGVKNDEVTREEARNELARLLADHRFHATERQKSILSYLVDQRLANEDDDTVKAYAIAVDVLRRPSNFDASIDPIVRIEMSRLRSALSNFYEAFGEQRPIWIEVTRGRYSVAFSRKKTINATKNLPVEAREKPEPVADTTVERSVFGADRSTISWRAVLLLLLLLAGAGIATTRYLDEPAFTVRPTVTLLMEADNSHDETDRLAEALVTALMRFQTVNVIYTRDRQPEKVDAESRQYRVEIRDYRSPGWGRSIWWQIAEETSATVLDSGTERMRLFENGDALVEEQVAGLVASKIAASDSVLNANERKLGAPKVAGNVCVLRAEHLLEAGRIGDLSEVEDCLEQTIVAVPDDPDANSLLARLLVSRRGTATEASAKARSLELAYKAVSSAPDADRSQLALMISLFAAGYVDAAIDAGHRGYMLNPYNAYIRAKLAAILYSQGRWNEGVALAGTVRGGNDRPKDALLVLAMDAYRRGNWSDASRLAEQIDCDDVAVHALRVAAQAQLAPSSAVQRLNDIRLVYPGFESIFYEKLAERRFAPQLVTALEEGLVKAGALLAPCKHPICVDRGM